MFTLTSTLVTRRRRRIFADKPGINLVPGFFVRGRQFLRREFADAVVDSKTIEFVFFCWRRIAVRPKSLQPRDLWLSWRKMARGSPTVPGLSNDLIDSDQEAGACVEGFDLVLCCLWRSSKSHQPVRRWGSCRGPGEPSDNRPLPHPSQSSPHLRRPIQNQNLQRPNLQPLLLLPPRPNPNQHVELRFPNNKRLLRQLDHNHSVLWGEPGRPCVLLCRNKPSFSLHHKDQHPPRSLAQNSPAIVDRFVHRRIRFGIVLHDSLPSLRLPAFTKP